jgi:hypothetical protein
LKKDPDARDRQTSDLAEFGLAFIRLSRHFAGFEPQRFASLFASHICSIP